MQFCCSNTALFLFFFHCRTEIIALKKLREEQEDGVENAFDAVKHGKFERTATCYLK